jgi:4-hydroxybenzoate polyprenyltransferase
MASTAYKQDAFDWRMPFFIVSLICISAWGYLLNDYCDIEADTASGKKNMVKDYSPPLRIAIIFLPFVIGILCFPYSTKNMIANLLFALQIVMLLLYSAKPFRLKERGFAGILADAFYGHINPVFITLFLFGNWSGNQQILTSVILSLLFVCTTLKGIRNILLHQIDDRKRDKLSGTKTFVATNGAWGVLLFINQIMPFEIAFTFLLTLSIAYLFPPIIVWLIIFSVFYYLQFSGWKLRYLPYRQLKFKFLFFLNDYYENWLPVFFLFMLLIKHPNLWWLIIIHLLLFPRFVKNLVSGTKTISSNLKTENDY